MADSLGRLYVEVTADTKKFDKSIDGTKKKTEGLSKTLTTFSKVATVAIAAVAAKTIKSASDLNESVNATNVVFKDSADIILEWGTQAAEQAGLSQRAFNESSAIIGTLLKKTGQDLDSVAESTIDITKRSADLASVFNKDLSVATTAVGAALRGETEPIRQFGIDVSAAAVEAEALSSGLVKNKNDITEAVKVQARYNLILKQSADVAGDFTNTNNELANSSRVLKADLENTAAELGQALLPIAKDVVTAARDMVKRFNELSPFVQKLTIGFGALAAALPAIVQGVIALKTAFLALNGPVGAVLISVTALVAGFKALQNARIDKLQEQFGDLVDETGKTAEEIGNIDDRLRLLINLNYDDINAAMKQLGQETDLTRSQIIKLALASDNLFEEEKVGLEESLKRWEAFEAERERVLKLSKEATTQAEKEQAQYEASQLALREQYLSAQQLISDTINRKSEEINLNQDLIDQKQLEIEQLQAVAFADKELEAQRLASIAKIKEEQKALFEEGSEQFQKEKQEAEETFNKKIQIEQDYSNRVRSQLDSRLELLDHEKQEAIKQAESVGADVTDIEQFYANERIKIIEDENEKKKEEYTQFANDVANQVKNVVGSISEIQSNAFNQEIERLNSLKEAELLAIDEILNAKLEALNQESEAETAYSDFINERKETDRQNEIAKTREKIATLRAEGDIAAANELQRELDLDARERELRDAATEAEKARIKGIEEAQEQARLDEEKAEKAFALEKWKVEKKLFESRKAASTAQAIINVAQGVTSALASAPPPFNAILAGITAAAGAIQIAAIQSEPAPARPQFATGGVAVGATTAVVGEDRGEVMFGMGAAGSPLINEFADRLANKVNGTGGTLVVNFNSMVQPNDEASMRRFARKFYDIKIQEDQRRGI